jgi:hypothetical protein
MRAAIWIGLILTVACRESRSGAPETGSAELEDTLAGVEYEAPRLIPSVRAQIILLRERRADTEENLTAFRNNVGGLVRAMQADLQRVRAPDSGDFRELSDSVLREEEARPLTAQVERLIGLYEQRMRAAAK